MGVCVAAIRRCTCMTTTRRRDDFADMTPQEETCMQLSERHREYWRRNLRVTAVLLAIWFLVTFVPVYFARPLNEITFLGWPLAFYMGAQGALIVYVIIIGYYARVMNRLDREYGVSEDR
jgi:putative solute:sodium symporter small subunit